MPALLSFQGRLRPLPYAASALAVLAAQYLAIFAALGRSAQPDWLVVFVPLRAVVQSGRWQYGRTEDFLSEALLLALMLIVAWVQAALAFRRVVDAGVSGWLAVPVIAPVLQLPTVIALCVLPSRAAEPAPPAEEQSVHEAAWPAAAQGVLAGMSLLLFAVIFGAIFFRTYGYGLFVVSPFLIGAATGYLANRRGDIAAGKTASLVVVATTLGGIALILGALEGALCIVMASPIGLGVALLGGMFGRAIALRTRGSAANALVAVALLPMVFASEQMMPVGTSFQTEESIEVAASPEAVWQALVDMGTIEAPPALPFRLGLAYPVRGAVVGEGVGATRIGVFSTGVAVERVTEWEPARKLAFVVLSDAPAMRELSPYEHVHAPHLAGYFRTTHTSFALVPLADGRTRIVEQTVHAMQLDPVLYWLPLARWIVHLNNARVLAHVRDQAERAAGG